MYRSVGSTYFRTGSTYRRTGSTYRRTGSTYRSIGSTHRRTGSAHRSIGSAYRSIYREYCNILKCLFKISRHLCGNRIPYYPFVTPTARTGRCYSNFYRWFFTGSFTEKIVMSYSYVNASDFDKIVNFIQSNLIILPGYKLNNHEKQITFLLFRNIVHNNDYYEYSM